LGEQRLADIHERLLGKTPNSARSSSNRHHSFAPASYCQINPFQNALAVNRTAVTRAISLEFIPDRLRVRKSEKWRYPTWVVEAKPYVDDPGADAHIPLPQRRSLLELNTGMCRWPVGDPDRPGFFFCGAPCHDERPYCSDHCARAYRGFVSSE
jgi:GcrA cell cycle regulator